MSKFTEELEALINANNLESGSDTPDFILANYLNDCLTAFNNATNTREAWDKHKGLSETLSSGITSAPPQEAQE